MPEIETLPAAEALHMLEITRLDIVLAGMPAESYSFNTAHGKTQSYAAFKYPEDEQRPPTVWRLQGSRADRERAAAQVRETLVEKFGARVF